jgi:hypothetical protein
MKSYKSPRVITIQHHAIPKLSYVIEGVHGLIRLSSDLCPRCKKMPIFCQSSFNGHTSGGCGCYSWVE